MERVDDDPEGVEFVDAKVKAIAYLPRVDEIDDLEEMRRQMVGGNEQCGFLGFNDAAHALERFNFRALDIQLDNIHGRAVQHVVDRDALDDRITIVAQPACHRTVISESKLLRFGPSAQRQTERADIIKVAGSQDCEIVGIRLESD